MAMSKTLTINKRTRKYKQSYFLPLKPNKYIGITPILCRSSWERAFCKFCDMNDNVVKWSSESQEIPYQIMVNNKLEIHRYHPDFYIEMTNNNDPERYDRLVIELKPKHETVEPVKPKKQTLKMLENYSYSCMTYKKNLHKWAYAKDWCEKRNFKFIIITEDDLRKKGLIPPKK